MTEHHDLRHEFPEFVEKIHDLKVRDEHFRKLFDEYHELDRQVRRMEDNVEPASDETMEAAKKRRLVLKDELYALLRAS